MRHGVRHGVCWTTLYLSVVVLCSIYCLYVVLPLWKSVLICVYLYMLARFVKPRGSVDPNDYASCIQKQVSKWCIVLGGARLVFMNFYWLLSSYAKKGEIESAFFANPCFGCMYWQHSIGLTMLLCTQIIQCKLLGRSLKHTRRECSEICAGRARNALAVVPLVQR